MNLEGQTCLCSVTPVFFTKHWEKDKWMNWKIPHKRHWKSIVENCHPTFGALPCFATWVLTGVLVPRCWTDAQLKWSRWLLKQRATDTILAKRHVLGWNHLLHLLLRVKTWIEPELCSVPNFFLPPAWRPALLNALGCNWPIWFFSRAATTYTRPVSVTKICALLPAKKENFDFLLLRDSDSQKFCNSGLEITLFLLQISSD